MLTILKLKILKLKDDYKIILLMSILTLLLIYFMGGPNGGGTTTVAVIDNSSSIYSKQLIEELGVSRLLEIEITDLEKGIRGVREDKYQGALIIPEEFGHEPQRDTAYTLEFFTQREDMDILLIQNHISENARRILQDINTSEIMVEYLQQYSSKENQELQQEVHSKIMTHWSYRKPIHMIKSIINAGEVRGYDDLKQATIGFTLFFSMFSVVFLTGEILQEKEEKTWYRLLTAPVSKVALLGANLLTAFFIGTVQVILLIVLSGYLFQIDWGGDLLGVFIVISAYVFSMTAIGMFLTSILKTKEQLQTITPVLLVSTSMLGGAFWPIEIIDSKLLLTLAQLTPQRWAMEPIKQMVMYGYDIQVILKPTFILLAMGLMWFTLGLKMLRFEN